MTEKQTEAAIASWLRGRPFKWPTPTPMRTRLACAWHILRRGDEGLHSVFWLLSLKIERGEYRGQS